MKKYENVKYGDFDENLLDIFVNERSDKTVIYIHGGGLEGGDKKLFPFTEKLLEKYSVVSIDYRMYPKAAFPQFIEDGARALSYVKNNGKKYGLGDTYCVFGCSAGAYIAIMNVLDERYLARYGLHNSDFFAFCIDSCQPTVHYNVLRERGEKTFAIRVDEAAPVFFLGSGKVNTRLTLITYKGDIKGRKAQNEMLHDALESYGIKHDFIVLPGAHTSAEFPDENGVIRALKIVDDVFDGE